MPADASPYVLVVDDDPDAQRILSFIVEQLGLEVRIAENGEKALEMAFELTPALVLLDIMMPQLNGLSVVAKLYTSPSTRDVPIILVSANIQNRKSLESLPNVVGVVKKAEFTVSSMMQLVARVLHLEDRIPDADTTLTTKLEPKGW